MALPRYPFIPKSTSALRPGQFWSVALPDGRFACGRVLAQAPSDHAGSTRLFLAGLLGWLGDRPPTLEDIAHRPVVATGLLHVKSVAACGGAILGHRPLDADGIQPRDYTSAPATWGFTFPRALAVARLKGTSARDYIAPAG